MKNYIIVAFVSLLVGAGLAYRLAPPRIETKTVVQEREVIKREIVKKDGTVIKEVVEKDKVVENSKIKPALALNRVNIHLNRANAYTAEYQRRIAGLWFIGASVNSEGVLGISLGLEF